MTPLIVARGVALALLLAGAACSARAPVPAPPPSGETARAVAEPGDERARTYAGCVTAATRAAGPDQHELIRCMESAGFGLLARPGGDRRSRCLSAIEAPDRVPEASCFQRGR